MASSTVKTKTGHSWEEWIKLLDREKASKKSHKEIAELLSTKYDVSPWWSQMVTVGYEQAKGLRVVHQTTTGFVAGVSRTIIADKDTLWKKLGTSVGRKQWINGTYEVTTSTPHKSLRIKWSDGSRVEMILVPKSEAKTSINVQHMKLNDARAVTQWKKFWTASLTTLKEILEA